MTALDCEWCVTKIKILNQHNEITLRDVILKLREHVKECRRHSLWLLVFVVLGLIFFGVKNYMTPTRYVAECTFMLNEQDGPSGAGISSILGQFGLGGGREFKLEKIAELTRTRAMTTEVMFENAEMNGESDWLANHFIAEKEKQGEWASVNFWEEPSSLEGFRFRSDSVANYSRLENAALKKLNQKFTADLETEIDEVTGILTFTLKSTKELLAYELLETLFDKVSDYYTNKSIEKQQATYNALAYKCDSLEAVLNSKEFALAEMKDSYRSQWLNTARVPQDKLFREIRMLTLMYGEALKNKEIAAFSLDNMTPFIQAIDRPIIPLQTDKEPLWRALVKGLILGLALGIALVVSRKVYRDIMQID